MRRLERVLLGVLSVSSLMTLALPLVLQTACNIPDPSDLHLSECIDECVVGAATCMDNADSCFSVVDDCFGTATQCVDSCRSCQKELGCDQGACESECQALAATCVDNLTDCVIEAASCVVPLIACVQDCIEDAEAVLK